MKGHEEGREEGRGKGAAERAEARRSDEVRIEEGLVAEGPVGMEPAGGTDPEGVTCTPGVGEQGEGEEAPPSCPECGAPSAGERTCLRCGAPDPTALQLEVGEEVEVFSVVDLEWLRGIVVDPAQGPSGDIVVRFVDYDAEVEKRFRPDGEGRAGTHRIRPARAGCGAAVLVILLGSALSAAALTPWQRILP